jgi:photosystem I subunit 3
MLVSLTRLCVGLRVLSTEGKPFMRRLLALALAFCLWFGFAPHASAATPGNNLTPCSENARFIQRASAATTAQAKARFDRYSQAVCGTDGLPRLIVDGRWDHAGDFTIPGLMFLYIAGWIGWAGRTYIRAVGKEKDALMKEVVLDLPLVVKCSLAGATWPLAAFQQFSSGDLTAKKSEITVSPR